MTKIDPTEKYLLVDPPAGWKYGFPAPLEDDYEQQLINAGYPLKDIGIALENSRYIASREMTSLEFHELVEDAAHRRQKAEEKRKNVSTDPIELDEITDTWKDVKL